MPGTRSFALLLLFVVALGAVTLSGCKKDKDEQVDPNVITVYSGRSESLVAPLIEQFEEETGMDVKVKYADSGDLAGTILEEGTNSPADVFWAQDAATLGVLAGRERLAELPDAILDTVDPRFRSDQGRWVGTSGRARVLAYNTDKLSPDQLPKSVHELTDPEWKGRVGWAPENASFQAAVAAMIELEGEAATRKWLQGMVANQPRAYPKNTPAVEATSTGEVDVALVNHYYLYRFKAENSSFPVANHYLRSGQADSLVNVSGAGILDSAPNRAGAEKFVAWLLDKQAQEYFARETYEFPVIEGVEPYADLPTINELNAPRLDFAKLDNLEKTIELLREVDALP